MKKYSVLLNPRSGSNLGSNMIEKLKEIMQDAKLRFYNILEVHDYEKFMAELEEDEHIILAGGDGTVNHFVNDIQGIEIKKDIYYYAMGSGNDFFHDIGKKMGDAPVKINRYLKNLPQVFLTDLSDRGHRFFNGVGFGLDGFVCEVGDRLRSIKNKPINYTNIALKALFFQFKPLALKVKVDGKVHTYQKAWMAAVMQGRYFGGGMKATPDQDRLNEKHTVSTLVIHDIGKLRLLTIFPTVFKGTHVKYTKYVDIFEGHDIELEYEKPTSLQIDGEPIGHFTKHRVLAKLPELIKEPVTV